MAEATTAAPPRHRSTDGPAPARPVRWLVAVPDRLVMVLFWTCLVVAPTVIAGVFRPVVVVPLLALVLVATWRLVPHAAPASRRTALGSAAALVLAAAWLALNVPFASRYLTVTRDAGFLTLEGIWLTTHSGPDLPAAAGAAVQAQVPGTTAASTTAYALVGDVLQVQGAKLVPGLMALGGWVAGVHGVLVANLVVGALALLAVYAVARRFVGPFLALVPVVALGASMPMTQFARAAYTEPVTLALVFGGLLMLWSALRTEARWRYVLAGAMVGAAGVARIDGATALAGLVIGLTLTGLLRVDPAGRRRATQNLLLAGVPALAMIALGYLDLRLHSRTYLGEHLSYFAPLVGLVVVAGLVGLVGARVNLLMPVVRAIHARPRAWATAAAALAVAAALFLASRPWWLVSHGAVPNPYVVGLQTKDAMPLDGTRTYDEMTLTWHAWYFGWGAVALAVAGAAVAVFRVVRRRDARIAVVLATVAAPTALYLWRVSIVPDQIWAMRRFLPVTIPALLVLATVAVAALAAVRRPWARPLAAVAALVVALWPVTTWGPLFTTVEQSGRLGEIDAVCAAVGSRPVLAVADRPGDIPYLPTIQTICGVPGVETTTAPTVATLGQVREAFGSPEIAVVTFDADGVPWPDGTAPAPLRTTTFSKWEERLAGPPRAAIVWQSAVWVAIVGADGTPVPAASS